MICSEVSTAGLDWNITYQSRSIEGDVVIGICHQMASDVAAQAAKQGSGDHRGVFDDRRQRYEHQWLNNDISNGS